MVKVIKVRKEQQCHFCDKPIQKGETAIMEKQYAYLSNQFLGQFYYHLACSSIK